MLTTEHAQSDVHELRFGYNLADLDRLTKASLWRSWGLHLDYRTRYDLAWSGVAEALYAAPHRPRPEDLIHAGWDALATFVRSQQRFRGSGKHVDGQTMRRFAAFWEWQARNTPSPENTVTDRLALWQIWAALSDKQRSCLLALATLGTQTAATASLGISLKAFKNHLCTARRSFLQLWHEGEEPSRPWGADRRADRAGDPQSDTSYRKAVKAIHHRKPAARKPDHEIKHGTLRAYNYWKCRCPGCAAAKAAESERRRRKDGVPVRRQMTVSQLADAVRRNAAGEPWSKIAASLGFSDSYLRSLRRGAATPIPDPPAPEGRQRCA